MEPVADRVLVRPREEEKVRIQRLPACCSTHALHSCYACNAQQSVLLDCASLLLALSADTACRVQQRTSSGLIMPVSGGKGMADALIGEVLAVGEDVKLEVAKGDVVIFSKYVLSQCWGTVTFACS